MAEPTSAGESTAPSAPTRRTVVSSAFWIGLGFGYGQVLRLASSIVLTRLLYPEAFGLMALAFTFLTGLILFSDMGIRTSIIQNPRGDEPDFLNTAWTLQVIRGFVLFAGACLLAWPAAYWRPNPEPDLLWLLPLFGLTSAIEGFISTNLISLYRHLAQRKAVLFDVVIQTASIAGMIVWAIAEPNVVALAVGPVLTSCLRLGLSHIMLPGPRNRFRWDKSALRDLLHFARWIYLGTTLFFFAGNIDKLVISYYSLEMLGVYHQANQLASAVMTLMSVVANQLIFPLYSRLLQSGHDLRPMFGRTHVVASGLAAVMIAGLIAVGPTLIRCMFDDRYRDAAWILPLLAAGAWFAIIESNAAAILYAQGKPKIPTISNGVKVLCLCGFVPLGLWLDGIRGLIVGLIAGDLAKYLSTAIALRWQNIRIFKSDLAWTLFAAAAGLGSHTLADTLFPGTMTGPKDWTRLLMRFAFEGLLVVAVWGAIVVSLRRRGYFNLGKEG